MSSFSSLEEGAKIAIRWQGSSWPARVKELDPQRSRVLVKYDEWSDKWNEWLSLSQQGVQVDVVSSPSHLNLSSRTSKQRIVVDVSIDGKIYKTANLKDGRTVVLDNDTGIISLCPTLVESVAPGSSNRVDPQPDSDPQKLPEGWIMRKDLKGSPYYFNTLNWKAQWFEPRLPASQVAENMQRVAETIPSGWEAYYDKDGYPYYYNMQTSETVWELPQTSSTHQSASTSSSPPEIGSVPDGWEIYFTDDGVPYFYCKASDQSYWELPEGVGSTDMDLPTSSNPFEESPSSPTEAVSKKESQKRGKKKLAN